MGSSSLNKEDHISKMDIIVNDTSIFEKVNDIYTRIIRQEDEDNRIIDPNCELSTNQSAIGLRLLDSTPEFCMDLHLSDTQSMYTVFFHLHLNILILKFCTYT